MIWHIYLDGQAAVGGLIFMIGFVAALMLFGTLGLRGIRVSPETPGSPGSLPDRDHRARSGNTPANARPRRRRDPLILGPLTLAAQRLQDISYR